MNELFPNPHAPDAKETAARFIGFATDAHSRQVLQMAAAAAGIAAAEVRHGGVEGAQEHLSGSFTSPLLLAVDLSDSAAPLAAVDALAEVSPAGTQVVAFGSRNDVSLFRGLRSLGVSDYLLKPLDADTLAQSIRHMLGSPVDVLNAQNAGHQCEIIACIGSRGGAGTTSVALSLAELLSRDSRKQVMLFDIDLQAGTVTLDLDLDPAAGIADLVEAPERLDKSLVAAALRPHRLGFSVLAGELPFDRQARIPPDMMQAFLAAAAEQADVILVDMPRRLDRASRALVRKAERVVVVTPPTLAGLRETRRLHSFITGLRAGHPPQLVLNRVGEMRAELSVAEFSKEAGMVPVAALPFAPDIASRALSMATAMSAVQGNRRLSSEMLKMGRAFGGSDISRRQTAWRQRLADILSWRRGRPQ